MNLPSETLDEEEGHDTDETREALLLAVDEELPNILASLELPPPLNPIERLIAKSICEGRGGFRAWRYDRLVAQFSNEDVVEDIRNYQLSVNARGTVANIPGELGGHTLASSSISEFHRRSTATHAATTLQLASGVPDTSPDTHSTQSEDTALSDKGQRKVESSEEWLAGGTAVPLEVVNDSKELSFSDIFPQVLKEGHIELVDIATLVGSDIRNCWARIQDGELAAIFVSRPDELVALGQLTRVPDIDTYKAIDFSKLLERRATISLSNPAATMEEERKKEVALLDALLGSVDLERQWERINDRRQHLNLKCVTTGLSQEENIECEILNDVADKRISRFAPPPVDRLVEIERYLRQAGLQFEGE